MALTKDTPPPPPPSPPTENQSVSPLRGLLAAVAAASRDQPVSPTVPNVLFGKHRYVTVGGGSRNRTDGREEGRGMGGIGEGIGRGGTYRRNGEDGGVSRVRYWTHQRPYRILAAYYIVSNQSKQLRHSMLDQSEILNKDS